MGMQDMFPRAKILNALQAVGYDCEKAFDYLLTQA